MLLYIIFDHKITSKKAFVVLGFFNSLRSVIAICIPYGLAQIVEAKTAAKRIKKVLIAEELQKDYSNLEDKKGEVHVINASVVLNNKTVLENVSLSLNSGLIGVTGPIGNYFLHKFFFFKSVVFTLWYSLI